MIVGVVVVGKGVKFTTAGAGIWVEEARQTQTGAGRPPCSHMAHPRALCVMSIACPQAISLRCATHVDQALGQHVKLLMRKK